MAFGDQLGKNFVVSEVRWVMCIQVVTRLWMYVRDRASGRERERGKEEKGKSLLIASTSTSGVLACN